MVQSTGTRVNARSSEPDIAKRRASLEAAERLMLADHPVIPLYFYVNKHLVSPRVGGWYDNVMNVVYSKDLTLRAGIGYEMSAVNAKTAFFFLKEAGRHVNDNGKIVTLVTSLLGAFTPFYAAYAGTKAPVEHFTRAASKEFGARGISVTAIGPGPMDTPFFYPAEGADAVAYHKTAAALSAFTKTGLTDIVDIVPFIRFLVSDGWWMTGQTILVNGGYTTK